MIVVVCRSRSGFPTKRVYTRERLTLIPLPKWRLLWLWNLWIRFYRDVLPRLTAAAAPQVYAAEDDLRDYLEESIPANAPAGEPPLAYDSHPTIAGVHGAWVVLECIDETRYYQASSLGICQAQECLLAAARLHASAWNEVELLELCETTLSRASFALPLRNPRELAGLDVAWKHFCNEFQMKDTNLGVRVQSLAEAISKAVLANPKDDHCTLIHGDYKAMNVFIPKYAADSAILVDYASCGIGLGMSDVAMHIHHAVLPEDLDKKRKKKKKLIDYVGYVP